MEMNTHCGDCNETEWINQRSILHFSKVWNDEQKNKNVRQSVLQSMDAIDFGVITFTLLIYI